MPRMASLLSTGDRSIDTENSMAVNLLGSHELKLLCDEETGEINQNTDHITGDFWGGQNHNKQLYLAAPCGLVGAQVKQLAL